MMRLFLWNFFMSEKDFNLLYDTAFLAQVVPNLFVAQNWLLDS
ncbi:capsid protein, partial [Escherichia coli]|nr:capsid protein [Escherichia coli]